MAGPYFLIGSGTGNWNHGSNWSLSSGGAAVAAGTFPLAADAVNLEGATPITVNVASACLSLVAASGYTGTLTVNANLTMTSTLTLASGMTVAGSAAIVCAGTATLNANGASLGCGLSLTAAATYTLASDWTVGGLLTLGSGSAATTVNGAFTITANGGLTLGGTGANVGSSGTVSTIKIGAGGTITGTNNSTSVFRLHLTIDAGGGTVTWANVLCSFGGTGTPTLLYVSGVIAFAGAACVLGINGACTINTGGMTWNKVSFVNSITVTLAANLNVAALASFGGSTNALVLNGFAINCAAGIALTYSTGNIAGTTVLTMTGDGTLDGGAQTARNTLPLSINAPGATIILQGGVWFNLATMTIVSVGSIINANAIPWNLGGGGPIGQTIARGNIGTY